MTMDLPPGLTQTDYMLGVLGAGTIVLAACLLVFWLCTRHHKRHQASPEKCDLHMPSEYLDSVERPVPVFCDKEGLLGYVHITTRRRCMMCGHVFNSTSRHPTTGYVRFAFPESDPSAPPTYSPERPSPPRLSALQQTHEDHDDHRRV